MPHFSWRHMVPEIRLLLGRVDIANGWLVYVTCIVFSNSYWSAWTIWCIRLCPMANVSPDIEYVRFTRSLFSKRQSMVSNFDSGVKLCSGILYYRTSCLSLPFLVLVPILLDFISTPCPPFPMFVVSFWLMCFRFVTVCASGEVWGPYIREVDTPVKVNAISSCSSPLSLR